MLVGLALKTCRDWREGLGLASNRCGILRAVEVPATSRMGRTTPKKLEIRSDTLDKRRTMDITQPSANHQFGGNPELFSRLVRRPRHRRQVGGNYLRGLAIGHSAVLLTELGPQPFAQPLFPRQSGRRVFGEEPASDILGLNA
jgi:hypothetical protein